MSERLPQRFRFREASRSGWEYGVCFPTATGHWRVSCGVGFGMFRDDPWELLGSILGDVAAMEWIDNDFNWPGEVAKL